MRPIAVFALFVVTGLAGCADAPAPVEQDTTLEEFGVQADETTGVILGVVVDQSISPVVDAAVVLTSSGDATKTDAEGRFAFGGLEPGTYFFQVSRWGHTSTQASAEVKAGVQEPPVVKVQIERLYTQEPYLDLLHFQGYFTCALSFTTCVNDYSRLCSPSQAPICCAGGCFGDEIKSLNFDTREYIYDLKADWHTITIESVWEPATAATANQLGGTVSFYRREGANHAYGGGNGPSPLQFRFDMIPGTDHPEEVPPGGIEDFFVFFSSGSALSVEQEWETFQHVAFYAPLPEGWSFANGDQDPFGN